MKKEGTFHLRGKEVKGEDLMKLFLFETPYQVDRMSSFLNGLRGKDIKIVVSKTRRPKSREALGMYWGAIVPATAMDIANLEYDVEKIYEDYRYYRKLGKIGQKNLDVADTMLRLEWHYHYTRRVDGKLYRLPKDLSSEDNGTLLDLIDKVMEWRAQNGYAYIDIEKYKNRRDSAELSTD